MILALVIGLVQAELQKRWLLEGPWAVLSFVNCTRAPESWKNEAKKCRLTSGALSLWLVERKVAGSILIKGDIAFHLLCLSGLVSCFLLLVAKSLLWWQLAWLVNVLVLSLQSKGLEPKLKNKLQILSIYLGSINYFILTLLRPGTASLVRAKEVQILYKANSLI